MKKNIVFIAVAAAVLIFLFFISTSRKVPLIPDDDLHRNATGAAACAACHAPGMLAPLKATHPPKEQCLICHKVKR